MHVRKLDESKVPQCQYQLDICFKKLMNSSTPLYLEIGPGVGLHPIKFAKNNPHKNIIAIEHTAAKFQKFMGRFNRHQLDNLFPVHANAISWVTHHALAQSLDGIFILYPNPNPKPGDLNKRFHAMPFMRKLLDCLKTNGKLILASNIDSYLQEASTYLTKYWQLELTNEFTINNQNSVDFENFPHTHFEKKYVLTGQACTHLEFSKKPSNF